MWRVRTLKLITFLFVLFQRQTYKVLFAQAYRHKTISIYIYIYMERERVSVAVVLLLSK